MTTIQKKNVNMSKICTKYLIWPIWNPSQHSGQGKNDIFFSLKSKYIHIRNCQKLKQVTDSNSFCMGVSQELGGNIAPPPNNFGRLHAKST